MDLAELYKVVTDAMDIRFSDPVDEIVEELHQALSCELAVAYMQEHGYERSVGKEFRFFKVVSEADYLDELNELKADAEEYHSAEFGELSDEMLKEEN